MRENDYRLNVSHEAKFQPATETYELKGEQNWHGSIMRSAKLDFRSYVQLKGPYFSIKCDKVKNIDGILR